MKIIFFFSFFLPSLVSVAEGINKSIEIRILIKEKQKDIKIKIGGKAYITEEKTNERYELVNDSEYEIEAVDDLFARINDYSVKLPFYIENSNPHSYIEIDGIKYKGRFRIYSDSKRLNIVEHIDLERYLWGVLAPEMGSSWPKEALKSQAVAARTYAIYSIKRGNEYDLTATTKHQLYTGFENISPQIISAVSETKGEVLTYKGNLFPAYYHANSGGHTTNPSGAWDCEKIPPLKGVKDPYAKYSKNYSWSIFLPSKDITEFLNRQGNYVSKIKNIRIYSKDKSGRAIKLLISTDKGNIRVEAKDLREFIGTFDIKSTFISKIEKRSLGFKIYGRGWGHGIGLCQDGAKKMADLGFNYKKILEFYYPGSKIMNIEKVYEY